MRYISTRGQAPPVSFLDAVLNGMAPDGGLYVPEEWPAIGADPDAENVATLPFLHLATDVLDAFAGQDLGYAAADSIARAAYHDQIVPGEAGRWPTAITPIRQVSSSQWLLELFNGPSLSFKDVAMQLIGPLFDFALKERDQRLSVICATSGDTGGAAVEALKNRERIDLFVLTPRSRISDVQRRFMTTSGAGNVHVAEVDGDFDACQAIVKAMFADDAFSGRAQLSAVNSINWARIVAQSVFYHFASSRLSSAGPATFVVPTGNFGDAYSGWVAKQCGAPINRIVAATNANDILWRALATGRYERGVSKATVSPAMDIQVASNFERILFEALGRDGEQVRRLYAELAQTGGFDIPAAALEMLRADFIAAAADDESTLAVMRDRYTGQDEISCPHTAVGFAVRDIVIGLEPPEVFLATAHPAKFPDTIERATGVRPQLPPRCADLFDRLERFDSLPADAEAVKQYIRERSRAWS